jgi:hypothetical protein
MFTRTIEADAYAFQKDFQRRLETVEEWLAGEMPEIKLTGNYACSLSPEAREAIRQKNEELCQDSFAVMAYTFVCMLEKGVLEGYDFARAQSVYTQHLLPSLPSVDFGGISEEDRLTVSQLRALLKNSCLDGASSYVLAEEDIFSHIVMRNAHPLALEVVNLTEQFNASTDEKTARKIEGRIRDIIHKKIPKAVKNRPSPKGSKPGGAPTPVPPSVTVSVPPG